ncbi:MAG: hypothetical protein KTQ49_04795 [Candidatus Omnitrophica bacterium]|nr:hypothetical protein [Candidatus Omnitrophota bacterium]
MIRVQKGKVTLAQGVIVAWAVALCFVSWLILHGAYKPLRAQLGAIEEKVFVAENKLEWLGPILEELKDPARVTDYLSQKAQELNRKFPDSEQRSLVLLARYAPKFRVQAVRIQPEPSQVFRDGRHKEVLVDQTPCAYVYTRMKLKADYKNLVKYFEALNKVLPAYFSLEKLEITDRAPASPRLEAEADLALYFLER